MNRQIPYLVDEKFAVPLTYCLFVSALSGILWSGGGRGSTWIFFPKRWLVVKVSHSKNVVQFSLIVTAASDCTSYFTAPCRPTSVPHTLKCWKSCTYFLILVTAWFLLIVKRGARQLWIITCLTQLRAIMPAYCHRLTKAMPMFVSVSQEHLDYTIIQSTNPDFNKAVVRVNVTRGHRQTVQVSGLVERCRLTPGQPWKGQ